MSTRIQDEDTFMKEFATKGNRNNEIWRTELRRGKKPTC